MNNRRRFVLASTAFFAVGALPRAASPQSRALQVPTVDSVAVRVLVDSSYDTPRAPASTIVKVRRSPFVSSANWRKVLHNEWGLALAIESHARGEARNLLLDYGYTPETLMGNMEVIGVDPTKAQALILSHGHFDHFGGLVDYLKANRSRLPADLTLYVGGEDNFCNRKTASGAPGHFSDWGVLDRRELEALKVKIVKCDEPTVILGHAFTTGRIARHSFERVLPQTLVSYHKDGNGVGCDMPSEDAKANGQFVQDQHWNEHATCYNVKDRGLVVISSCGHAGIVNSVQTAIEVSGVKKVHAVMGGFHLFPAPDDYVRQTVAELQKLGPDVIIPLHCSGPNMAEALRAMMPQQYLPSTTGTEFTFGA
ncbi:MAG TPA: MBL fold metallo-hydrolase [Burkholderiales bacterium]|nr:MBL fold metallo-hydrolase [Burkholderiales bacterium]